MSCSWYQPQTCLGTSRARAWSAAAEPRLQQDVLSSQQSSRAVCRQSLSLLLHPCIWERHMDGCRGPPAAPSAPGGNR